jgi:hypothetical protein
MKKTILVTSLSLLTALAYSQQTPARNFNDGLVGTQEAIKAPEISQLQLSINYFNEFAAALYLSKIENLKEEQVDLALGKIDSSKNLKELLVNTLEFTNLLPKQIKTMTLLLDTTFIPKLMETKDEATFNQHLLYIESNIENKFKQDYWVGNKQIEWINKLKKED